MAKAKEKKRKCEAGTPLCSNKLVRKYGVNGSEKTNETFDICGACAVYIRRGGSKLKAA